jgi:hypothetical protein
VSGEDLNTEFKSLRLLTRDKPDWAELARDCVGLANALGGGMLIRKPRTSLLTKTAPIGTQTSIERPAQTGLFAASRSLTIGCDIDKIVQIQANYQ